MLDEKLRCVSVSPQPNGFSFHPHCVVFFSFLLCCLHFERDFKSMLTILWRSRSLTKSCLKSTFAFITNLFYLKWANQHTFNTVSIPRSLSFSINFQWCVSPSIATQKIFSMHMKSVSIKILSRYWMLFINYYYYYYEQWVLNIFNCCVYVCVQFEGKDTANILPLSFHWLKKLPGVHYHWIFVTPYFQWRWSLDENVLYQSNCTRMVAMKLLLLFYEWSYYKMTVAHAWFAFNYSHSFWMLTKDWRKIYCIKNYNVFFSHRMSCFFSSKINIFIFS